MSFESFTNGKTTDVVRAPRIGVSHVGKWLVCAVLALLCTMWITPVALADGGTGLMTDNITDTQNLLGSNASAVTDKVKETYEKSGVYVRLIYVDSFGEGAKPTEWAKEALEATNPKPNTVLLAVASADGSLVVSVSSNSDEWLRDSDTVDALSKAAMEPLSDSSKQDWSGSAIAMMDEIQQRKQTSTNSRTVTIGVIGMGAGLAVLVIVIVVTIVVRRRREVDKDAGEQDEQAQASTDVPSDDGTGDAGAAADVTAVETPSGPEPPAVEEQPSAAPEEPARPMTRRELREARKRQRGLFGRKRG
ncbi:TPM domain-containing protein [Bifidobacterium sp. CP2]|uniref:TPM domain-containing protein n=1 Tax=Bifidobacterium sp. CP2 TaxID=2809025 RepID=UPI001BDD8649|nr:TPM domain-containing protein [Bifidobacterium sp. CP2]MBT1180445.1 TPM domain-containing protein [Bifidobacterium sp. CP2]